MPAAALPRRRRKTRARADPWIEAARFLVLFLVVAIGLRTFVVMPRSIPSESMMPGLVEGDYLLVAKWPYGWSRFSPPWASPLPHGRLFGRTAARGDVVVFRAPPDDRQDYIKRVIGLPGDRVQTIGGRLWLNGRILPRVRIADFVLPLARNTECRSIMVTPYGAGNGVCRLPRYRETLPGGRTVDIIDQGTTIGDDFGPVTVPANRYFLMGDNRDMSADSRFPAEPGAGIGMVPADNLEGRARMTFFSTGGGLAVRPSRGGVPSRGAASPAGSRRRWAMPRSTSPGSRPRSPIRAMPATATSGSSSWAIACSAS